VTPRRIAYVVNVFPKLSETFIAGELAELRRRGVDLRILSLRPAGEGLRHDIVARTGLPELTVYDHARFPAVLRELRPELVHAHFATEPAAAARELAADLGVPFTFTGHGYDIYRRPPADFAARAEAAAGVVTVSEENARYIADTFGVPRARLTVIPSGIDTDRFRPNGRGPEPPHVVCVARLARVKNLGLLLDACALLEARGVHYRCVLVGDGPAREELAAARARLRLEGVVELVGAADQGQVLEWWRRAAVAVLTSENEGMPVSLMEAAACGVPAVATAVGGVSELVVDGETGLLTPPGDADALATALERLIRDPETAASLGAAARRRAEERFSVREHVDRLLAFWTACSTVRGGTRIRVKDRYGVVGDPELPTLRVALDPAEVKRRFKHGLPRLAGRKGVVRVRRIRVVRHKPGRRCVVEYDLRVERPDAPREALTVVGKVRSGRSGAGAYRLLDSLWHTGFDDESPDGISVPEPISVVKELDMWLQRKAPGIPATDLLGGPDGVVLARRIAEAAYKLHQTRVRIERTHDMADELRILRECLRTVARSEPRFAERTQRLLDACGRLGAATPDPEPATIHRDFYADHVIVDGSHVSLVDFDLCCIGDPALDIGNFLGHVSEQSLRTLGDPDALGHVERELEERFVELSGETRRAAVRAYAALTLARHVYLSMVLPKRRRFTEALLELSEERVANASRSATGRR